jgi:SAM-dependent methyltransferase
MARYVLAHGGEELEGQRMELLDRYHGPLTEEEVRAAGVGPGWRCLDVGAGSGAMTRRLASLVAPDGRVVAVDRETHWLEPLAGPLVEVLRADVVREALPQGFDLVLAQMLVLHLPDPVAACRSLLAAARPGGWVVVHDADFGPVALPGGSEEEAAGLAAMTTVMRDGGVDLAFGPRLAEAMRAAGAHVEEERSAPGPRGGGSPGALICAITLQRFRGRALELGVRAQDLDAAIAALQDPGRDFVGPTCWVVRCRRPG